MRRGSPERRPIPPDMRYNSVQLQTLVQHVMKRGKKSTALRVIYGAMDLIQERTQKNPLEVFDTALKNVSPAMAKMVSHSIIALRPLKAFQTRVRNKFRLRRPMPGPASAANRSPAPQSRPPKAPRRASAGRAGTGPSSR